MSGYRSRLWSRKAGIVERVADTDDSEALLRRISKVGRVALRLRGLKPVSANHRIRAAARQHLLQAQRLIRKLGDPDMADKTASLREGLE